MQLKQKSSIAVSTLEISHVAGGQRQVGSMQINGYRLDLGHKGEPHATSYTSHLNTMGVLLNAESNSGD